MRRRRAERGTLVTGGVGDMDPVEQAARSQHANSRAVFGAATAEHQIPRPRLPLIVPADMQERLGEALLQCRADVRPLLLRALLAVNPQPACERRGAGGEEQAFGKAAVQGEAWDLHTAPP